MTAIEADPFVKFKAAQRESWSSFVPVEAWTTPPAAKLVKFAQVQPGQRVLDIGCGTGVVAISAARHGAKVSGLDLTPVLVERARKNAGVAGVDVEFIEGDAEAPPYPDNTFDLVLSQFGHMFAPRPAVVVREMLRVLKPGGRIAFSTWPPEHVIGQMFALVARNLPPPPADAEPYAAARPLLPKSLPEALDALDNEPLFRRALGDTFIDYFLKLKRTEVGRYLRALEESGASPESDEPSAWEQNEYFDFF